MEPDRVSRSRRASRASHRSPPRTTTPSTPGLDGARRWSSTAARAAAIDGHARLLLAWTAAINLTAIRDPGAVALAHVVDSLTAVPLLRDRGRRPRSSTSARAAATRACRSRSRCRRARALLVESIGKKAALPRDAVAPSAEATTRPRAGARRGRRRSGPRPSPRDPRHRGRWPGVTARAVASPGRPRRARLPAARARAASSSPGSAATSPRSSARGRTGRSTRSAAGRLEVRAGRRCRRSTGHVLVVVATAGPAPAAYPRDPGGARRGGRGERRAATLTAHADRGPLGHPQQPRGPRRGPRRRRRRSTPSGTSATSSGYGPEPDAVVERLDGDRRDRRPRQPRRGGRRRHRDRLVQPRRPAGPWSGRATPIAPATRDWLAALPERLIETTLHARPRQPARPDLGVRHLGRDRPGRPRRADDAEYGLHGHTHVPIAYREVGGRMRGARPAGRTARLALGDGRSSLLNPGSVGQPRDGDPRASYLILDTDARDRDLASGRLRHRGRRSRAMRAAGLPVRLAERLRASAL